MRVAPIRRALEELLRKRPPPPSTMRSLPEATDGYPWRRTLAGKATPTIPPRVAKPTTLLEAQTRASKLAGRRWPMLERPELHRHHRHHQQTKSLIAGAGVYVLTHDAPPPTPPASPVDRYAVAASLPAIEESIKPHQWGKQWRANDIRLMVELEPRTWQEGEGR